MAGSLPQSGVALIAQNAGKFLSDMRSGEGALGSFQRGAGAMSNIVTGAFRQVGAIITNVLAGAVRAVGQWLKASVGVAGDFEQTLNVLGATSGATGAQLDQVAAKAKELGADLTLPATSAQDAAQVMLELSKAGFSVEDSMNAAKGALQLSAAAQVDAAKAAQITAGAINAFGLAATDAVRVADLLAAGANASSASMTDLSQGLQQAGFMFHAVGMPIEDLVTSLAALTNVGLTGSDAGTALKNAITRLVNPTKKAAELMEKLGFSAYDANGKMKPLTQIITELQGAFVGMTDEEKNAALGTIFLSDGMKAMIPLLGLGADGFNELKSKVTVAGSAADVAGAQMKGWNGAVASAKSQMETLQLIIGTLIKNALTPLLFHVADIASKITTFADRLSSFIPIIQASGAPLHTFLTIVQMLNPSLSIAVGLLLRLYNVVVPMVQAFQQAQARGEGLAAALTLILGPLGATQTSIAAAVQAIHQIEAAFTRVGAILQGEMPGALSVAQAALAGVVNFILGVVLPALAQAATWFADNLPAGIATAKAALADIGSFIQTIMPTIQSIVTTALSTMTVFWQQHGDDVLRIITIAWELIKGAIQVALGIIQGTMALYQGLITGDWDTAMKTMDQAATTIWNGISTFLSGILNGIAGFFGTTLDGIVKLWQSNWRALEQITNLIIGAVASFITTKTMEMLSTINRVVGDIKAFWDSTFGGMRDTVESVMSAAASIVQSKVDAIAGAFGGIKGAIDSVIGKVKDLVSALASIHVPDILTPGSPTPFEIGLRGIDAAARQAAATFQTQFNPAIANVPALQRSEAAPAPQTTNNTRNYSMPIHTSQSPAVLSQAFALIEATTA